MLFGVSGIHQSIKQDIGMALNFTNEQEAYMDKWATKEQSAFYIMGILQIVIAIVFALISLLNLFPDWHTRSIWLWLAIGTHFIIGFQNWRMARKVEPSRRAIEKLALEGDKSANLIIFFQIFIIIFGIWNGLLLKSVAWIAFVFVVIVFCVNHIWRVRIVREFKTLTTE
jgi:hypothetical protein